MARELSNQVVRTLSDQVVAQLREIFDVCLCIFCVLGDLGLQGAILGTNTGRIPTFGAPCRTPFSTILGSVFEVLFGKVSGSRF